MVVDLIARQGKKVQLTPGTFLSVDDSGNLQVQASAEFREAIGLGNVDDTTDAGKPISTATQTALDAKQPLDADLTYIASLVTTSYGRSILTLADAAALRTLAGLGNASTKNIGTTTGTVAAGDDARFSTAIQPALSRMLFAGGFGSMRAILDGGYWSTGIFFSGDSAQAGEDRPPWLFAEWIASNYPGYTVKYAEWDADAHAWEDFTTFATGAGGARRWVIGSSAAAGVGLSRYALAQVAGTEDLDISFTIKIDSWASPGRIWDLRSQGRSLHGERMP